MIQNLPRESRPREKLIRYGAESLSDAELLAIILRTGTKGLDAIHLAQDLIDQFEGLSGLLKCGFSSMNKVHGLGLAKYAQIAAIKEISQRSLHAELKTKNLLDNPEAASNFLLTVMGNYQKEVFACLLLDARYRLNCYEEVFSGSLMGASVYPREIVKLVLNNNAAAVILAHNHPSGDTDPSEADKQITNKLIKALSLIDVRVLDHIIVGDGTLSMAEQGLL